MYRILFLLTIVLVYFSCQPKTQRSFLLQHPTSYTDLIPKAYENEDPCKVRMNYLPDTLHPEHTPLKYVKVNFHIVRNADSTANFDEKTGRIFINEVMDCANNKLGRNKPMHLPIGNNTPVVPMRYRYKLTPRPNAPDDDGIYFHYDEDLYGVINNGPGKNNFDREVFNKYGIQKDTVMNVFILDYPKDSIGSPTFKRKGNGVAFGNWIKITGWYYNVQDTTFKKNGKWETPKGKWYAQKSLNHEVGHNLGLNHSWTSSDGCDDTPKHPNCYNWSKSGPCKENWSNNFMDYNVHASAWTPCQIAIAHQNMTGMGRKKKLRAMLEPTWCTYDPDQKITITDSIFWNGAKDLESDIEIKKGGVLTIRCKVSLPKGAKISIAPGGTLFLDGAYLYNDCGDEWEGIEIIKEKKIAGVVIYGEQGAEIQNVVHGEFNPKKKVLE